MNRKVRKPAAIIQRQQIINHLTGQVEVVEQAWRGYISFIENAQIPQNELVPVADAWAITEQHLENKTIVVCQGKSYTVLKIADHGSYRVASLKAATAERYVEFRADMVMTTSLSSDTTFEFQANWKTAQAFYAPPPDPPAPPDPPPPP